MPIKTGKVGLPNNLATFLTKNNLERVVKNIRMFKIPITQVSVT